MEDNFRSHQQLGQLESANNLKFSMELQLQEDCHQLKREIFEMKPMGGKSRKLQEISK